MIKKIIFLGAPGVGKGTLAKKLASEKGLIHISTGDIFRKEIKQETELGLKIKSILASGEYVSDDITNQIVKKTIEKPEMQKNGFILDGYPRTINQAEFLKKINARINAALLLDASDQSVAERIMQRSKAENRVDDTPEVINNRIKIYREKTAPLIDWYKKEKLLVTINAEGTIEENFQKILGVLY